MEIEQLFPIMHWGPRVRLFTHPHQQLMEESKTGIRWGDTPQDRGEGPAEEKVRPRRRYRVTLTPSGQRSGLPDLHSSSLVFAASSYSFYLILYCDYPLRLMIHVDDFVGEVTVAEVC